VRMGHPGVTIANPDHLAITVMNGILGGNGFTSRITTRVRSDEGLAYQAGSSFQHGYFYDGAFAAVDCVAYGVGVVAVDCFAEYEVAGVADGETDVFVEGGEVVVAPDGSSGHERHEAARKVERICDGFYVERGEKGAGVFVAGDGWEDVFAGGVCGNVGAGDLLYVQSLSVCDWE